MREGWLNGPTQLSFIRCTVLVVQTRVAEACHLRRFVLQCRLTSHSWLSHIIASVDPAAPHFVRWLNHRCYTHTLLTRMHCRYRGVLRTSLAQCLAILLQPCFRGCSCRHICICRSMLEQAKVARAASDKNRIRCSIQAQGCA